MLLSFELELVEISVLNLAAVCSKLTQLPNRFFDHRPFVTLDIVQ